MLHVKQKRYYDINNHMNGVETSGKSNAISNETTIDVWRGFVFHFRLGFFCFFLHLHFYIPLFPVLTFCSHVSMCMCLYILCWYNIKITLSIVNN